VNLSKWRRASQFLPGRGQPGCAILLYHRVADDASDPLELCVSPANFEQQMRSLQKFFRPVPLAEATERSVDISGTPRVAVTFDDGYRDVLYNAKPVLERYGIPATVFVATGILDSERGFWWDDLAELVLGARDLPAEIVLEIDGHRYRFPTRPSGDKAHARMNRTMRTLDAAQQQEALAQVCRQVKRDRGIRKERLGLTSAELVRLADGGIVEIGAHTLNHPVLSNLSVAEQSKEIVGSKRIIEDKVRTPVTSFAYPYGNRTDFNGETAQVVARAGFLRACSATPGVARSGRSPFALPRIPVKDWSEERLLAELASLGIHRGAA
jgi:peptidoglycan/xylan/chitin deacetylase (PgdA/CDA1 family)